MKDDTHQARKGTNTDTGSIKPEFLKNIGRIKLFVCGHILR